MRRHTPAALEPSRILGANIFAEQPDAALPPQPTYTKWVERCRSHLAAFDRVFIGRPDDVSTSDLRLIASDLARRYTRALRTLPDVTAVGTEALTLCVKAGSGASTQPRARHGEGQP